MRTAGKRYGLIAAGGKATAKRFRTSNKCFINSPADKKAKIYCQALAVLRESNSRISVRDY
jgi:hypothetical protein